MIEEVNGFVEKNSFQRDCTGTRDWYDCLLRTKYLLVTGKHKPSSNPSKQRPDQAVDSTTKQKEGSLYGRTSLSGNQS